MLAISFDIAAMHVSRIIDHNMPENAKSGWLSYGMRFYSSSLKARIWGTVRSAPCRFKTDKINQHFIHAAVKLSAEDEDTPTKHANGILTGNGPYVHSVDTSNQKQWKKAKRI